MKQWQPLSKGVIEDPQYPGAMLIIHADSIAAYNDGEVRTVNLPDNYRLCQLVEVNDPLAGIEAAEKQRIEIWEGTGDFDFVFRTSFNEYCAVKEEEVPDLISSLLWAMQEVRRIKGEKS